MRVTVCSLLCLVLTISTLGCGKPEKITADIDVAEAQASYDEWSTARIEQIKADPNLSDAEKEKQIAEIKESAAGQMDQVRGLAGEQGDERGQGR